MPPADAGLIFDEGPDGVSAGYVEGRFIGYLYRIKRHEYYSHPRTLNGQVWRSKDGPFTKRAAAVADLYARALDE
jgi:hypothetical protein